MDIRSILTKAVVSNPITKLKAFRGYTYTDARPGWYPPGADFVSQELQSVVPTYVTESMFETNLDGTPYLDISPGIVPVVHHEALLNINTRVETLEAGVPSTLQVVGTSTPLTNATLIALSTLTIPAGTWSITGTILCTASALAVLGSSLGYIEVAGETVPWYAQWRDSSTLAAGSVRSVALPARRVTVTANTVITLRLNTAFTLGTATGQGYISALRVG